MARPVVQDFGAGRAMLDLGFRDEEGLVASFLLPQEDGWTVVETGPTTCIDHLVRALSEAGVGPSEVRRVFVTHIHLDHAGGLGRAAEVFPNSQLFAHRSGVPHLVDPSRLIESARRAWGASADRLWGPIPPAPASRVVGLEGGERFPLSSGHLEVVATPGHARHHVSFFDSATGALMSGDSAGVLVEGNWRARPAIPPPDLELGLLFESLETMKRTEPKSVLLTHFGAAPGGAAHLSTYRIAVEQWRDAALAAARVDPNPEHVAAALRRFEEAEAARAGAAATGNKGDLISGYSLAAQGLLRYFRTHRLLAE